MSAKERKAEAMNVIDVPATSILPPLHLAVHHTSILTFASNVMHFSMEAGIGQSRI
jgi:hypothetical protein